jgi:hypothetical protein
MKGLQIISEGRTQTEERRVEAEDIYEERLRLRGEHVLEQDILDGGSDVASVVSA